MSKLGVITIGQAPRADLEKIITTCLPHSQVIQVGVLDGFTKEEIEAQFTPESGQYVLTSRMKTGESVIMSREKIFPIVQQKIVELEEQGCRIILMLCTGEFEGLRTNQSIFIEPDIMIPPVIKAMMGDKKVGIIAPLQEQKRDLVQKWVKCGVNVRIAAASPYTDESVQIEQSVKELIDHGSEILLFDCMGYTEDAKKIAVNHTDAPVILSNELIFKILSAFC